jgi:hypothetical protein
MREQRDIEEAVLELLRSMAGRASLQADFSEALIAQDILKDPEEYEDFLEKVSTIFGMESPKVADMKEYKKALAKIEGFHISDIFRRRPTLHVPDMTVARLAEIIRTGSWPEAFLLPPPQGGA